jgi:glucose/arabinose dehydrogenase
MIRQTLSAAASLATFSLVACTMPSGSPDPFVGFGPNPPMASPQKSLIPTVGVPDVVGWPPGAAPKAPPGFVVTRFAEGLDHPRWLYVLPNGDVLVSESASEPSEADKSNQGIKGFFQKLLMKRVGSAKPSPNKIFLLRDADGDGVAETKTMFAQGLTRPFGMALVDHDLYVANTDAILRFPYVDGATSISAPGVKVTDLPAFPIDHHWTKNIIATPDGRSMFATVGSNSNVADKGMAVEEGRAAIWLVDLATGKKRLYATGLRNANGMDFQPTSGALWAAVNERDELGNDLVPDYMTSVKDGAFYGWPYSYYGQNVDARVKPQRPDLVARAIPPDYALGAHTASLGLAFYRGAALPPRYRGGAFIGQHGSWNRAVRNGYQVIFVPFTGGMPSGDPEPVLTGFVDAEGHANGRPVGVVVDNAGALLVADDVGNAIWRVRWVGARTATR